MIQYLVMAAAAGVVGFWGFRFLASAQSAMRRNRMPRIVEFLVGHCSLLALSGVVVVLIMAMFGTPLTLRGVITAAYLFSMLSVFVVETGAVGLIKGLKGESDKLNGACESGVFSLFPVGILAVIILASLG